MSPSHSNQIPELGNLLFESNELIGRSLSMDEEDMEEQKPNGGDEHEECRDDE